MVGPFEADFYQISGLYLESRKRREHLTSEDLQKNKAIIESLTKGNSSSMQLDNNTNEPQRRKSLPPPPSRNISWEDYISSLPGKHVPLGRELNCKETVKAFKATLAMVSKLIL
jgi:ankyrin repeat domain-containing protein 13